MTRVSLRIYNREIESLINQGHSDEAAAHCHHILEAFPKHLETHRLLGKAFLETKQFDKAANVFSRVIIAVPDDFVAHVGLSIICDEQTRLDDAIWHMERAFEVQPNNAAIQGELQRLYSCRDGKEPSKIRMTRGALAHMYVQAELYPQAIAEIRAVLAQEADRADMQVLLARAYFRGGQKADASDMCAQLLKRYQYCFDANRIMVDLLPSTAGVAESTQVYRMRVGEMDPYATFAKGSVFLSDEVADAAINLERLEYKGEEETSGQAWGSTLGLGSGIAATPASQSTSQSNAEIPDFLRQAGWGESSIFDEEPAGGGLAPAEIPDWLKGQEPVNATPTPAPQPEPVQPIEVPDWPLDNKPTKSAQADNVPDWSKEMSPATPKNEDRQNRSLHVFLCHSSNDKPTVRKLYHQLSKEAWIDPWLDEEKLDPGDRWNFEIGRAVKNSDIVIVCL
jgi:tetratricopeptide (TPR) repeat protein